jgi:P27 family predicted phage terminase small subunit
MPRPRKPTNLHIAQGTFRKDRHAGDEPQPQQGTPKAPRKLSEAARSAWKYYAPLLADCRVITLADRDTLACFCEAIARKRQAENEIAKTGVIVKSVAGGAIPNPWLKIARDAATEIRNFGSDLGLNPISRAKLRTPTARPGSVPSRNRGKMRVVEKN